MNEIKIKTFLTQLDFNHLKSIYFTLYGRIHDKLIVLTLLKK